MLLRQMTQRFVHKPTSSSTAQVPVKTSGVHSQWRLELFFKSKEDLESQIPFLRKHNITRLNITNKSQDDNLLQTAQLLKQAIPGVDLCIHYSIKYNYDRTPDITFSKLQKLCTQLQQEVQQQTLQAPAAVTAAANVQQQTTTTQPATCHMLLVSGGGKKKRFDTVAALQQLQAQQSQGQRQHHSQSVEAPAKRQRASVSSKGSNSSGDTAAHWPSIAVAFNPYLPTEREAAVERQRLRAKLQTGLVDRVYLQVTHWATPLLLVGHLALCSNAAASCIHVHI